jgi:hypothetical protein
MRLTRLILEHEGARLPDGVQWNSVLRPPRNATTVQLDVAVNKGSIQSLQ